MKTKLRGIFLTSEHPDKTTALYRDVAGLELEQVGDPSTYVYWKQDQDGRLDATCCRYHCLRKW
jgi:hypothetical protein